VFGRDAARLQVQLLNQEEEVRAGARAARVARWAHAALAELSGLGFAEAIADVFLLLAIAYWSQGVDDGSRRRARLMLAAARLHYSVPQWELAQLPDDLVRSVSDAAALQRQVRDMIGAGEDVFRHLAPSRAMAS
jgi:hypothetical protein